MPILINNVIFSTNIFIAIFVIALLVSLRSKKEAGLFPVELTQELKGFAILAIVFSHVGYFLAADSRFLFPLSIMAGVGVNLFLFLSGYGLTMSSVKKRLSPLKFYQKRLLKLFTPLWIVLIILFLADFFILHITRSRIYIVESMLGFFPHANLYLDVDSPFWFLTPLIFYYLLFPLVIFRKQPWLTAIIIFALSYLVLKLNLKDLIEVQGLYKVHILAFPLGVAFASLFSSPLNLNLLNFAKIKLFFYQLQHPAWLKLIINKIKASSSLRRLIKIIIRAAYFCILAALLFVIAYYAYYSGVGGDQLIEQLISLLVMLAVVVFFMMKKFEIKLFYLFGVYSFNVYMIHWPLMMRYDIFFKYLPGWLAMTLYLCLFILISWALSNLVNLIYRRRVC
jgi:peptidoglycan/LPS O-acetylase OafA/YrhL